MPLYHLIKEIRWHKSDPVRYISKYLNWETCQIYQRILIIGKKSLLPSNILLTTIRWPMACEERSQSYQLLLKRYKKNFFFREIASLNYYFEENFVKLIHVAILTYLDESIIDLLEIFASDIFVWEWLTQHNLLIEK